MLCAAETEAEKAERQEREAGSGRGQRAPRRGRASAAPQHSLEVRMFPSGVQFALCSRAALANVPLRKSENYN